MLSCLKLLEFRREALVWQYDSSYNQVMQSATLGDPAYFTAKLPFSRLNSGVGKPHVEPNNDFGLISSSHRYVKRYQVERK